MSPLSNSMNLIDFHITKVRPVLDLGCQHYQDLLPSSANPLLVCAACCFWSGLYPRLLPQFDALTLFVNQGLKACGGEQFTSLCKIHSWQSKTELSNKDYVKEKTWKLLVPSIVSFASDLSRRTRKRYLYAPGRAQFAAHSSWRLNLASSELETLLWRGWLSSFPWRRRWSGKPLRWCLLGSWSDYLEQKE